MLPILSGVDFQRTNELHLGIYRMMLKTYIIIYVIYNTILYYKASILSAGNVCNVASNKTFLIQCLLDR